MDGAELLQLEVEVTQFWNLMNRDLASHWSAESNVGSMEAFQPIYIELELQSSLFLRINIKDCISSSTYIQNYQGNHFAENLNLFLMVKLIFQTILDATLDNFCQRMLSKTHFLLFSEIFP